MADPQVEQVTSKTPAKKQKNEKRVAAGKATSKKTNEARAAQKKALEEAQATIAELKQAAPPSAAPPSAAPPSADPPPSITTTQWLSVISIIVSLVGIYYKREDIKSVFTKKTPVELPRAPPPSPVDATPKRRVGIMKMD